MLHKAKKSNSDKVWKIYRKFKSVAQRTCTQTHGDNLKTLFKMIDPIKNCGHILKVENSKI